MGRNEVSTLKKGLLVLEHVKSNDGITLSQVMDFHNLSKSTAFRMLTTLEEMNYVYKIRSQYYANPDIFRAAADNGSAKGWASMRSIYQFSQDIGMSTYLGKVDGTELVMTQVLHPPFQHPDEEEVGNRSKLHQSALGKSVLANMTSRQLEPILEKLSLEPATANTFQDSQLFRYHLKAVHEDGYAFDDEERIIGIRCVAVPVMRNNEAVASLAVAAPADEIPRNRIRQIAAKLHAGSKAVTQEMEALNN